MNVHSFLIVAYSVLRSLDFPLTVSIVWLWLSLGYCWNWLLMIIRSFHFIISAKAFSDLESINMPTPFYYSLLVLRYTEVVINVNFSYFSYLIFSSWKIVWSTIPGMFILIFLVSSISSFHLYCRRIVRMLIIAIFNIWL